ncbi:MAG: AlpA family phage regulatory protein [Gallionella sp.]|nr:AlpA family phage regulatory protein [Gallionella sp.]
MSKPIQVKRLIRREELLRLIPLSDSAIYRLEKSGGFPIRFNLTPRCVVWDLDEVENWIQERRSALIQSQLSPDVQKRKFRPVRKQA